MYVEIHYAGTVYHVAGGPERATDILVEARTTIAAGGGTIEVETVNGTVTLVIGAAIPFAVAVTNAGTVVF